MKRHLSTDRIILSSLFAALMLFARAVWAAPIQPSESPSAPCAVVDQVGGEVEILDSTRKHTTEASLDSGIDCSGWVSTRDGWVQLHHRDGYVLHVAPGSFVQIQASAEVVLYRGQVLAQAETGTNGIEVLTPNARARLSNGTAIVAFDSLGEESQVIGIEQTVTFENRFESHRRTPVKAGEASSLNFKLLRVVPSDPRAVAVASLKEKLSELHASEHQVSLAVQAAKNRQERTFASALETTGRNPASTSDYSRHQPSAVDEELQKHMADRMVAGVREGAGLLNTGPSVRAVGAHPGHHGRVEVEVKDTGKSKAEDKEKRRLLEELSRVGTE